MPVSATSIICCSTSGLISLGMMPSVFPTHMVTVCLLGFQSGQRVVSRSFKLHALPVISSVLSFRRSGNVLSHHSMKQLLKSDRKSVVQGKSVSVRVDLGCRRRIKKKQQTIKLIAISYTKKKYK